MKLLTGSLLLLSLAHSSFAGDEKIMKTENPEDWCDLLSDKPGTLYHNKQNPWIDKVRISGRLHMQAGLVSGTDVRGNRFSESFDDLRRLRLETDIDFLKYFDLTAGVDMVSDRRYRTGPGDELDLGYRSFANAYVTFDIAKAFGSGPFDDIELSYGRMRVSASEEIRTSSNRLRTMERSAISNKLAGEADRQTGVMLEVAKGDWSFSLGMFSGEDDSEFIGGWNDGKFYYASVAWEMTTNLRFTLDHVQNDESGSDDALGYAQVTSLAAVYEADDWGLMVNVIHGDNGGAGNGNSNANRQGDFDAFVVEPWYWLLEDKLQLVARYQYAVSDEAEGIRLSSRYIRGLHSAPSIDLDNGYGDEHHSFYIGLNYYLCGSHANFLAGISYDTMNARTARAKASTYMVGLRTRF